MQVRFLLGPAGSGKTFRCLAEVREALRASPQGPALLFLAPKQATFQLERQLLADPVLAGYTRLQILSFERLAEFILAELTRMPPALLSDEGTTMVLRALLTQNRHGLRLFHASARLPGFAKQLSQLLREFQRYQVSPRWLETLASRLEQNPVLAGKLSDVAGLFAAYLDWLRTHDLLDASALLDLATEALGSSGGSPQSALHLAGLWMDGFAEMTPQELALLAAVVPLCEKATLAFCLDQELNREDSWFSPWSTVGQSFRRCYERLQGVPGTEVHIETLGRQSARSRFADTPVLAHLERAWTRPVVVEPGCTLRFEEAGIRREFRPDELAEALRVVCCANPAAEARWAAREIVRHVRGGGRYRECAVLLRNLEGYHNVLRRAFRRYEIPFFLDRREPVAHHPLAELTRNALRSVTFHWRPEDWFGVLKSGLLRVDEGEIDRLENEALARGWRGDAWLRPMEIRDDAGLATWSEQLRQRLVPPFQRMSQRLGVRQGSGDAPAQPTGADLAEALRGLWDELRVSERLAEWSRASRDVRGTDGPGPGGHGPIHLTVWQQMNEWLDNLALGFPKERLPLREWLPILEAGLDGLTAGLVPPALDQVLIGTIDRSRNPELQLALLLGLNEGRLPAKPPGPTLLTETEREELATHGVALSPNVRQQLARERYYGYIGITRASRRLVLSCSARDADDQPLNPSPFLGHLSRLFPALVIEQDAEGTNPASAEHASELLAPLLRRGEDQANETRAGRFDLRSLSTFAAWLSRCDSLRRASEADSLSPTLAERLYGPTLRTSVSRLEQFAACPFRFLVDSGLLAEERKRFELDAREQGSFQHEVLACFHEELRREHRRWRDLTPSEARARIGRIAAERTHAFREGLLGTDSRSAFTAGSLTSTLQDFVDIVIGWMAHYGFDPHSVELAFGGAGAPLPAWELELGDGHFLEFRGKIDRVDLAVKEGSQAAQCVVMDYKSGTKRIDPLLQAHGIQIQLPAYLRALGRLPDAARFFGVPELTPAGFFYVNLRGHYEQGQSRHDVLQGAQEARRSAYRHRGRFSLEALSEVDQLHPIGHNGQFSYRITSKGLPDAKYRDLVASGDFRAMLDRVENQLVAMGRRIFAGEAQVDPYRLGNKEVACGNCSYRAVCRIDPWTHEYRLLRQPAAGEKT